MSVKIVQNNQRSDAPSDINANLAAIAGLRIVGFNPIDGTFRLEFDLGDLTAITNGSLVKDILARDTGSLKIYNAAGSLQQSTSLLNLSSPTGAVTAFAMDTPPTDWLECDGSAVSRTTYAVLFATIGVRYGVGNGSTTFNLPDLRGEFIRGWDNGAGIDPNAGSRTDSGDGTTGDNVGTKQAGEIASHTHNIDFARPGIDGGGPGASNYSPGAGFVEVTNATGGSETRPRNIYMMYCIKT